MKVINAIAQLAAREGGGRTHRTAGNGDLTGRNHFEFSSVPGEEANARDKCKLHLEMNEVDRGN